MDVETVRIRHVHIPDVSIPDDDRSDIETRAVAWHVKIDKGRRIVVEVATGGFSSHRDLAGQVAERPATKFTLPKSMAYESAVLIGLLAEEGLQVTVVCTTHGYRERTRLGDERTDAVLHRAAAGVARAVARGYELDHEEPPEEPYDMDQLPEPISEEFDVTPEMLVEFDRDVQDGTITLHEEIGPAAPAAKPPSKPSAVIEFIKEHAVGVDVLADE